MALPIPVLALAALAAAAALAAPRFLAPPIVEPLAGGALAWSAAVDCADSAAPALLGARAVFTLDYNLDGAPEAADSSGLSPADCDDGEGGRLVLRRTFFPAHPAVLRAVLRDAAGNSAATGASHAALTAGLGSLLSLPRYCARPKNGEPEWVEIRNLTAFTVPLASAKLEMRALSGTLNPGEAVVATAAADTAELRLWQPGARGLALSSWPGLRNSGDTIRMTWVFGGITLALDSIIYGSGAYPREDCASLADEGSAAAASGYTLEFSATRWRPRAGEFSVRVRAPEGGRYDLRVYDLDGRPLCALAREATGAATYALPSPECARLATLRGTVILHLAPRGSPGVRRALPITE